MKVIPMSKYTMSSYTIIRALKPFLYIQETYHECDLIHIISFLYIFIKINFYQKKKSLVFYI